MANAQLLAFAVENFKSFETETRIDLKPLTIIIGRNNSGKSSLIQSLLLLKQTLSDPRPEVMLRLDGIVDAFNLRELTFGWPQSGEDITGPKLTLEWESSVDMKEALDKALNPYIQEVARNSGVKWLENYHSTETLRTKIQLITAESQNTPQITEISLWSERVENSGGPPKAFKAQPSLRLRYDGSAWNAYWHSNAITKLEIQVDHFIPFLAIDRRNLGPRHRQRAWHAAYLIQFEQPLADLIEILSNLHFLGSNRMPPKSLYSAATSAPNDLGVSGELAAQLLHKRQTDFVHYLPPVKIEDGKLTTSDQVNADTMLNAVNTVLNSLSIESPVNFIDVQDLGFRFMFGRASLGHVGRGLNSVFPVVEVGLFADPLRFTEQDGPIPLSEYLGKCSSYSHIALEEPEAHLHPKIASRLAHWFVSLARTKRNLIVETQSDHLVRRLRGMIARAGSGSELEAWLLQNVTIVSVEQTNGRSTAKASYLTAEGGVEEDWPSDFMDEAPDEESAIFYAKLEKTSPENPDIAANDITFIEGEEPEIEKEP